MNKELVLKVLIYTAITSALAGVFMLYLQPGFMINVAEQVWFCIS